MNKNYIALTIGPIYETMSYCQKTRELWTGSYFFSYFMRSLMQELVDLDFIIPYVDKERAIFNNYFEEGVFHDRFIAQSETLSKEQLKTLIENKIDKVLNSIAINLLKDEKSFEALKKYFQYTYIIATEKDLLAGTDKENIIFAIDAILDSMELQNSFDFNNSTKVATISKKDHKQKIDGKVNPIAKLQYETHKMKNIINDSILSFKSIPFIATADIMNKNIGSENLKRAILDIDDDNIDGYDEFYKLLQQEQHDAFKPHHKYYAVIYADGDKMGSTIRSIYNDKDKDEKIKDFSKNIYEYITKNSDPENDRLSKVFDDFGGMLIFAGGDDILALCPIFGKDGEDIFTFIEKLSERFKEQMKKSNAEVSLSFGLSIQYYKSPMIGAIDRANDLLFNKAKKHNTADKSGSLALSLTKHSGQTFNGEFFISDDESYDKYKKLFTEVLNEKVELPHNIQYALKKYEYVIIDIFKNYQNEAEKRIDTLFKKLIEGGDRNPGSEEGLKLLKEYCIAMQPSNEKAFRKLITQLAIIKFLRGDK